MLLHTLVAQAAEGGTHELNPIWFPAPVFGLIMLVLLATFLLITLSFHDVANRHAEKAERFAKENDETPHH